MIMSKLQTRIGIPMSVFPNSEYFVRDLYLDSLLFPQENMSFVPQGEEYPLAPFFCEEIQTTASLEEICTLAKNPEEKEASSVEEKNEWTFKIEKIALGIFNKTKSYERCATLLKEKHDFHCTGQQIQDYFANLGMDMNKAYDALSEVEIRKLAQNVKNRVRSWRQLMLEFKRAPVSLKYQYKRSLQGRKIRPEKVKIPVESIPKTQMRKDRIHSGLWGSKIEEVALGYFNKTQDLEKCARILKEKHNFDCTGKQIEEYFTKIGIDIRKAYDPLSEEELRKLADQVKNQGACWTELMTEFKRSPRYLRYVYNQCYLVKDRHTPQIKKIEKITPPIAPTQIAPTQKEFKKILFDLVSKYNYQWEGIAIEMSLIYQASYSIEYCYTIWADSEPTKNLSPLTSLELIYLQQYKKRFTLMKICQLMKRPPSLIKRYLHL